MRRAIYAVAVIGLALAIVGSSEAQAQIRFGIGFGSGYGGYPGYGGYGYGPGLGGMYGNYMVPGNPYYGNGRPSFYRGGSSYPSYQRRTVTAAPNPQREGAGLPIKIVSPDDARVTMNYSLNEYDYSIAPGHSQMLFNDRDWIITFDRGDDFGTARYSLSPGTYQFALTKKGWEIYHDADVSKLMPKSEQRSGEKGSPAKNIVPQ